ncbi:thiolase domain-containing protein [Patescibacteria group bacterium]
MNISVLGAYQTKFGELWQKSLEDLFLESCLEAIRDANILKKDIQIIYIGNKLAGSLSDQNHLSSLLTQILKINVPVVRVEAACASGGVAVSQACMAIASEQYETALVVGVEKMTDLLSENVAQHLMSAAGLDEQDSGLSFVGLYALMAMSYLQKFKAPRKSLAAPAIKNHFHASLNKKAHFPFCINLAQVLKSPVIAQPLTLLECSPISDGAAAIVLSSSKFAKKRQLKNGVKIVASSLANENISLAQRQSLLEIKATKKAALQAYNQAGLGPKEISFLEVHDCFTIAEIIALEDLGLYKKGYGFKALENGEVKLGGKRPVNLSGGLKGCGHPVGATGVKQIVEVFNQLKNRAGVRQTKDPKIGLTHNVGGTGGTAVVHILQKKA